MGVGGRDVEAVRSLARAWLSKDPRDPASAASLRPLRYATRGK
jgi:hypothetical protein